jgi:hypothetical protein
MGKPLTRVGIIELANEIILDTYHSSNLAAFKNRRQLKNEICVGISWYCGFLKRNTEFLKHSNGKIQHQNRMNWCTYQNFLNMNDGVYSAMVKAIVAIKTPDDRMYDRNGERVFDKNLIPRR